MVTEEPQPKKTSGAWGWVFAGALAVVALVAILGWGCECSKDHHANIIVKYDTLPPTFLHDTVYLPWAQAPILQTRTVLDVDTVWIQNARMSYVFWDGSNGLGRVGWLDTARTFKETDFRLPLIPYSFFANLTDSGPVVQTVDLRERAKVWRVETELGGGFGLRATGIDTVKIRPVVTAAARLVVGDLKLRRLALAFVPLELEFSPWSPYITAKAKLRFIF